MLEIFTSSSNVALWTLFILTYLYFLENFDRYLIAVSPIPYIDYSSYEYSILVGPAFTIIYTIGGLVMALGFYEKRISNKGRRSQGSTSSRQGSGPPEPSTAISGEVETDGMVSQSESNERSTSSTIGVMNFSKYMVITAATFIFSSAFFCTGIATTFWQQVVIRVTMGLAQSVITPFSSSIIRDHFVPSVSGAAFGIFNVGTYIAFSLSLSLGIFIYLTFGWKAGYLLFGLIGAGSAFLLPLLYFCYQNLGKNGTEREKDEGEYDSSHGQKTQLLSDQGQTGVQGHSPSTQIPQSPTSSYLSQEAITLSALHHHSVSSRSSSSMNPNSNPIPQSSSFSANYNQSSMIMSTNSSQFINSHQQAHLSGSFAHSVHSVLSDGGIQQHMHPFHNGSNRSSISSTRQSGGHQVGGTSFHSTSFHHDIPSDVLQTKQSNSNRLHLPNNRESFQGSLSTVDVDDDGNNQGTRHKDSLLSDVDFDEEEYHQTMIRSSLFQRIRFQLVQIIGRYWWRNPGVIVMCIATGVRIGGGYIWSAYTGPFFSDLFQYDNSQDDCSFSYADVSQVGLYPGSEMHLQNTGSTCDSSYPYCVDGTCAMLSDNPWHNQVGIMLQLIFSIYLNCISTGYAIN